MSRMVRAPPFLVEGVLRHVRALREEGDVWGEKQEQGCVALAFLLEGLVRRRAEEMRRVGRDVAWADRELAGALEEEAEEEEAEEEEEEEVEVGMEVDVWSSEESSESSDA